MPERIFISHDSVEAAAADVLLRTFEGHGHTAFVARTSIKLGMDWASAIAEALATSTACLVLCSARSVRSQWVWMEFGAASIAAPNRLIPVILPGLDESLLPEQFTRRQLVRLDNPAACQTLLEAFAITDTGAGADLFAELQ